MKKVSVIIPLYNQSAFLLEAVDSVRASTYKNIEIIVVNDESTDITEDSLREIIPEGVKIINQSHMGVCEARNRGILASEGEYILTLDADDKIHPDFINKAVEILEKNENIGIVYAKAEYFGEKQGEWYFPKYNKITMLINNLIPSFGMFRKKDWAAAGGYKKEMLDGGEDWEFWISLIELGIEPYRIEETLLYYRRHSNSKTSGDYEQLHWKIFSKILILHSNLYSENIRELAFPLFYRLFKEQKLKEQVKYLVKLFIRAFLHPITRIINRKTLKKIMHIANNTKININD